MQDVFTKFAGGLKPDLSADNFHNPVTMNQFRHDRRGTWFPRSAAGGRCFLSFPAAGNGIKTHLECKNVCL